MRAVATGSFVVAVLLLLSTPAFSQGVAGIVRDSSGAILPGVTVEAASPALIEKSREFTLVPWRPVLDRHVGKAVGGIMRCDDVSWTIGRKRGRGIS